MDPTPNVYDIGEEVTLTCTFLVLATRGSMIVGQNDLTVRDAAGYAPADPVLVAGAGTVGGDLVTTISSIAGNILSLAAPAQTSVTLALVGRLQNQTTTTCRVKKPDGLIADVTATITNTSTGKYKATFVTALEGDHFVRWLGTTGATTGTEERQFVAREARVV